MGKKYNINEESKGIKIIRTVLESLNVEFIKEFKFDDCKNKRKLPFDFYLPKYKMVIEFDGEHHFRYKGFWSNGRTPLEETQKNDQIKNKFAKKSGMKLIRLPFNVVDRIETILRSEHKRGFLRNLNLSKKLIKKAAPKVEKNDALAIVTSTRFVLKQRFVENKYGWRGWQDIWDTKLNCWYYSTPTVFVQHMSSKQIYERFEFISDRYEYYDSIVESYVSESQ